MSRKELRGYLLLWLGRNAAALSSPSACALTLNLATLQEPVNTLLTCTSSAPVAPIPV